MIQGSSYLKKMLAFIPGQELVPYPTFQHGGMTVDTNNSCPSLWHKQFALVFCLSLQHPPHFQPWASQQEAPPVHASPDLWAVPAQAGTRGIIRKLHLALF